MGKFKQIGQGVLYFTIGQLLLLILMGREKINVSFSVVNIGFVLFLSGTVLIYLFYWSQDIPLVTKMSLDKSLTSSLVMYGAMMIINIWSLSLFLTELEEFTSVGQRFVTSLFLHSSLFLLGCDLVFCGIKELKKFFYLVRRYSWCFLTVVLLFTGLYSFSFWNLFFYIGWGSIFCIYCYKKEYGFEISYLVHLLRNCILLLFFIFFI